MKNFSTPLAIYPGRFVSIDVPWQHPKRELFIAWLKQSVPMNIWDKETRRWAFPEDYAKLVIDFAITCDILKDWHRTQFEKTLVSKAGATGSGDAFSKLMLTEGAPNDLVELVYRYWTRHYMGGGANPVKLAEVENAKQEILGS